MNANAVLGGEAIVALSVVAWRDVKQGYAPLPGSMLKTGISFGLISVLAYASPELACLIGGGFLLAQIIKYLQNPGDYKTVLPDGYQSQNVLLIGSKAPIAGTSADF
jgi:hypothetical protein